MTTRCVESNRSSLLLSQRACAWAYALLASLFCVLPAMAWQEPGLIPPGGIVRQSLKEAVAQAVEHIAEVAKTHPDLKEKRFMLSELESNVKDSNHLPFMDSLRKELQDKGLLAEAVQHPGILITPRYIIQDKKPGGGLRFIEFELQLSKTGPDGAIVGKIKNALGLGVINDSGEIAQILAVNSPISTVSLQKRNEIITDAHDQPSFMTRVGPLGKSSLVQSPGSPDYAVEIRRCLAGNGKATSVEPRDVKGVPYVDLDKDDTFEIVVYNFSKDTDAIAKITIDGLDVISTFCIDQKDGKPKYPGYVVPRGGVATPINGWLETAPAENAPPGSMAKVYKFVITTLGKGAADERKAKGNRGIVNVQFHRAVPQAEAEKFGILRGESAKTVGRGQLINVNVRAKAGYVHEDLPVANVAVHYE